LICGGFSTKARAIRVSLLSEFSFLVKNRVFDNGCPLVKDEFITEKEGGLYGFSF
jgi:hypothetical protein